MLADFPARPKYTPEELRALADIIEIDMSAE
jgi:hypothetical protein